MPSPLLHSHPPVQAGGPTSKPRGPHTSLLPAGQPPSLRAGRVGCQSSLLCASTSARPWHRPRVCRRLQLFQEGQGSVGAGSHGPEFKSGVGRGGEGVQWDGHRIPGWSCVEKTVQLIVHVGSARRRGNLAASCHLTSQQLEASERRPALLPMKTCACSFNEDPPAAPLSPSEPRSVLIRRMKPALQPAQPLPRL